MTPFKFDRSNRRNLTSSVQYNHQVAAGHGAPTMLMDMAQKLAPVTLQTLDDTTVQAAIHAHRTEKDLRPYRLPRSKGTSDLHSNLKRPPVARLDRMIRSKAHKGLGLEFDDPPAHPTSRPNPLLVARVMELSTASGDGDGACAGAQAPPPSRTLTQAPLPEHRGQPVSKISMVPDLSLDTGSTQIPSVPDTDPSQARGSAMDPSQAVDAANPSQGADIDPTQTLTRFDASSSPIPKPRTLAQKVSQHVKCDSVHESLSGDIGIASPALSTADTSEASSALNSDSGKQDATKPDTPQDSPQAPELVHPTPKRLLSGELVSGMVGQDVGQDVVQDVVVQHPQNNIIEQHQQDNFVEQHQQDNFVEQDNFEQHEQENQVHALHNTCDPNLTKEDAGEYPSPDMTKVPFQYARVDPDKNGVFAQRENYTEESPQSLNDLVEGIFEAHPVFRPSPKIQVHHHTVFDDVGRVYGTPRRRSVGSMYLPPEALKEEVDENMVFYPAPIPAKLLVPPTLSKPADRSPKISDVSPAEIDTIGFNKANKRKSVMLPIPPPVWGAAPSSRKSMSNASGLRSSVRAVSFQEDEYDQYSLGGGLSDDDYTDSHDDTDAATIESDNSYQAQVTPELGTPQPDKTTAPKKTKRSLVQRINIFRKAGEDADQDDQAYEAIDDTQAFTTYNDANLRAAIGAYEANPKPSNFVDFHGAKNLIEELELRKANKQHHQRHVIKDAVEDAARISRMAEQYMHPLDRPKSMSLLDLQKLADIDYRSQVAQTQRSRAPETQQQQHTLSVMARSEVNGIDSLSALRARKKAQKAQEAQEMSESLAERRARLKREKQARLQSQPSFPMDYTPSHLSHVSVV